MEETTAGGIDLEKEYKALCDKYKLVAAVLNARPVKNRCTEQLEKFHALMAKDFQEFTRGESTMTEDAIALSRLQEVEKELKESVSFPMLSTKNIVAVAGGFSSGKSKFINAIIRGGDVKLSTGVNPVTAIPTFVQQGESAEITAYAPDGRQGAIPVDLFNKIDHKFIEELGFNLKSIMPYTTVTAPFAEKLAELGNLCLIDTPGYDPAKNEETEEDRSTAFDVLGSATAVLWFIDIDNGTLHKKDVAFLNKMNGLTEDDRQTPQKKLFVVISKADRKESQVQKVIDRVKEDLEENDIPYEGISAFSANKNKEYMDEDDGKSLFDWLREQNKNLVDTAMKIRLLKEKVEGVFQMYHDSIARDTKKMQDDKKIVEGMRLSVEKRLDAKDQELLRLQQNSTTNYYRNRGSYKNRQSDWSTQEDDDDDDNAFDEASFYSLVDDRSSVNEKNDKKAYRICRDMLKCIDGIFSEMNPELLKNVQYKKFCGKCGTKLEGKYKFCPKCGAPTTIG
ncbi:MAG: dynamin family protein [Treponema sp.]|nr:dynamin family protein [Treponema sp.]